MKKASKSSPARKAGTKPYRKPNVKAYGNIHDITAGTGHRGNMDSQSPVMPNKTLP